MTSHAAVSLAEGQALSQITDRDISELTEAIDAIDQVRDLIGVLSNLTEASGAAVDFKRNKGAVIQAASEKLDDIRGSLKAWPSSGMVTIEQP